MPLATWRNVKRRSVTASNDATTRVTANARFLCCDSGSNRLPGSSTVRTEIDIIVLLAEYRGSTKKREFHPVAECAGQKTRLPEDRPPGGYPVPLLAHHPSVNPVSPVPSLRLDLQNSGKQVIPEISKPASAARNGFSSSRHGSRRLLLHSSRWG